MIDTAEVNQLLDSTEQILAEVEAARGHSTGDTLYKAAETYQRLCHTYGYLQTFYPGTHAAKRATKLVHVGRRVLYGKRLASTRRGGLSFWKRIPHSYALLKGHCALAALVALLSAGLTALLVYINPEFGWNFLSEEVAMSLREGKIWTEEIRGMSSLASSQIAVNNIKVSFMAFALGITGGALTVVILVFNGAHIGGLFAALAGYDMAQRLLDFILAHGFLELSVIAVAAGCGLYIGDALIHPGSMTRKEALQAHARPAIDVVIFSALCLIPAGLTEGYISPYGHIPTLAKLGVGLFLAALYWSYLLTGRLVPVFRR